MPLSVKVNFDRESHYEQSEQDVISGSNSNRVEEFAIFLSSEIGKCFTASVLKM